MSFFDTIAAVVNLVGPLVNRPSTTGGGGAAAVPTATPFASIPLPFGGAEFAPGDLQNVPFPITGPFGGGAVAGPPPGFATQGTGPSTIPAAMSAAAAIRNTLLGMGFSPNVQAQISTPAGFVPASFLGDVLGITLPDPAGPVTGEDLFFLNPLTATGLLMKHIRGDPHTPAQHAAAERMVSSQAPSRRSSRGFPRCSASPAFYKAFVGSRCY